jgi:DNA-binding response OmpR family regulator
MNSKWRARLLLVEDENVLRGLIAQFLRSEGFDLTEAADGREGVERYSSHGPFDVVLLDLNLPIFPGIEVCRRIKQLHPGQPVIICSAAILDGHIAALESLRVDQFLSKPYHPADLLNRIAIELKRAAHPRAEFPESPAPAGSRRADQAHSNPARAHTLFKLPVID